MWAANAPATFFPHGLNRGAAVTQAPRVTLATTGNSSLGLEVKA